jgi:hypothetical protein
VGADKRPRERDRLILCHVAPSAPVMIVGI